jgi:pimeloyl-ACP methyl ester carboxylesterase
MSRLPRLLPIFVLALGLPFTGATTARAGVVQGPASAASGDFAELVDIGGRRLYLECHGTGSPTVVLVAGYDDSAFVWAEDLVQPEAPRTMVLPGVAAFTHVCVYDRPGTVAHLGDSVRTSRSDPVPQPSTAPDAVADLHTLLHVAGVPGPYVLAGHSGGGLLVRLYASTYPDEVEGLVLVDAWSEELKTLLPPRDWAAYARFLLAPLPDDAGYPEFERFDWDAVAAAMNEAEAARPLGPMPLAVLAHAKPFDISEEFVGFSPDAFEAAWGSAQRGLATVVPSARFFVASESAHNIHQDQPELVIEAIRQVVSGVRDPDTWYDLNSCCAH